MINLYDIIILGILVSDLRDVSNALIQLLIADSAHLSTYYIVILAGSHDTAILAVFLMLFLHNLG